MHYKTLLFTFLFMMAMPIVRSEPADLSREQWEKTISFLHVRSLPENYNLNITHRLLMYSAGANDNLLDADLLHPETIMPMPSFDQVDGVVCSAHPDKSRLALHRTTHIAQKDDQLTFYTKVDRDRTQGLDGQEQLHEQLLYRVGGTEYTVSPSRDALHLQDHLTLFEDTWKHDIFGDFPNIHENVLPTVRVEGNLTYIQYGTDGTWISLRVLDTSNGGIVYEYHRAHGAWYIILREDFVDLEVPRELPTKITAMHGVGPVALENVTSYHELHYAYDITSPVTPLDDFDRYLREYMVEDYYPPTIINLITGQPTDPWIAVANQGTHP